MLFEDACQLSLNIEKTIRIEFSTTNVFDYSPESDTVEMHVKIQLKWTPNLGVTIH